MPLYEFECTDCGARFEQLTSFSNATAIECARCGAPRAKRLLSVIAGVGGRSADPTPGCGAGACGNC